MDHFMGSSWAIVNHKVDRVATTLKCKKKILLIYVKCLELYTMNTSHHAVIIFLAWLQSMLIYNNGSPSQFSDEREIT